jgi:hypothetical protein
MPAVNRRDTATRGVTSARYSQAMTVLSRRAPVRRSGRRPGWLLLTALLVLAIGASSALVFTNRVELLKLAVILALWAAVVAAFVSVIYRRQSDLDQARVRDLKLVYDLQLDREISARREYELTVESQLRRELASEFRAQAADEVAALRAELAALRTNLEILFDTDLTHRPALETERTTVRGYSDWAHDSQKTPADWVSSNRVTSVRPDEFSSRADHGSIIDVPEEPLPPRPVAMDTAAAEAYESAESYQGSYWRRSEDSGRPTEHRRWEDNSRRAKQRGPQDSGWGPEQRQQEDSGRPQRERYEPQPQQWARPQHEAPPEPEPRHAPPQSEPHWPRWGTTPAEAPQATPQTTEWQPVRAEGQRVPPATPGSNWVSSPSDDVVATANGSAAASASSAAVTPPEQRLGRHASSAEPGIPRPREAEPGWQYGETGRHGEGRHSTDYRAYGSGMSASPPPPEASTQQTRHAADTASGTSPTPAPQARHRGMHSSTDGDATQRVGQSVADLLARLQTEPTAGGRRRRREE